MPTKKTAWYALKNGSVAHQANPSFPSRLLKNACLAAKIKPVPASAITMPAPHMLVLDATHLLASVACVGISIFFVMRSSLTCTVTCDGRD